MAQPGGSLVAALLLLFAGLVLLLAVLVILVAGLVLPGAGLAPLVFHIMPSCDPESWVKVCRF